MLDRNNALELLKISTDVVIPDEYDCIVFNAFRGTNITSVDTNNVTEILDFAFYQCKKLRSVNVKGNVKAIGKHAFAGCYKLENLVLSDSVEEIMRYAFCFCSIKNLIGKGVKRVGKCAFSANKMESAFLPELLSAEDEAFSCNCFREFTLTDDFQYAGYAFLHSPSTEQVTVDIGKCVGEFHGFKHNSTIKCDDENKRYSVQNGCLTDKSGKVLFFLPEPQDNKCAHVPQGIEAIAENAISFHHSEYSLYLPDSVLLAYDNSIQGYYKEIIAEGEAVYFENGLSAVADSITFKDGSRYYHTDDSGNIFEGKKLFKAFDEYKADEIGGYSLQEILSSQSLDTALSHNFAVRIDVPQGTKVIHDNAFSLIPFHCTIDISKTVVEISEKAFMNCNAYVTVDKGNKLYRSDKKGYIYRKEDNLLMNSSLMRHKHNSKMKQYTEGCYECFKEEYAIDLFSEPL